MPIYGAQWPHTVPTLRVRDDSLWGLTECKASDRSSPGSAGILPYEPASRRAACTGVLWVVLRALRDCQGLIPHGEDFRAVYRRIGRFDADE